MVCSQQHTGASGLSQSSGMNQTENLWQNWKHRSHQKVSRNINDLKVVCKEESAKISKECCKRIVKSYGKGLQTIANMKYLSEYFSPLHLFIFH